MRGPNCLPIEFANESPITRKSRVSPLKSWAGIGKSVSSSICFCTNSGILSSAFSEI
jgi:hypothetical protein